MNKYLLVLGAGQFQRSFIKAALDLNLDILLFDKIKPDWISGIQKIKYVSVDISDLDLCIKESTGFNLIGVVSPYNDAGILSASQIATARRLPGPGVMSSKLSRDKLQFRTFLKYNNFNSPECLEINNRNDLLKFSKIFKFPLVIKPNDGSGSRGVFYVDSMAALEYRYENSRKASSNHRVILETFIPGNEYSAECLIQNGKFFLLGFSKKTRSSLPRLLDVELLFPYFFDEQTHIKIISQLERLVKLLNIQSSFLHVEFIMHGDDFYIVEFGVRGAAFDVYTKLISWSYDTNLDFALLNLTLGIIVELPNISKLKVSALKFPEPQLTGTIIDFSHKNGIYYVGETKIEVRNLVNVGDVVTEIENGSMRISALYYFAQNYNELSVALSEFDYQLHIEAHNGH